jgi:hypothetical protein
MVKCHKCGFDKFFIEKVEGFRCQIKEEQVELVKTVGCRFENLFCYRCGIPQKLDYSRFEFVVKY